MRPILLAIFGALVFLMALQLAQQIFALDSPQMRWFLLPISGWDDEQRYAPGGSARDWVAYGLALLDTGLLVRGVGRLLYRVER